MKLSAWTAILALGLLVVPSLSMIVITKSSPPCVQEPISRREEKASVIVTGFIDKVVREPKKTAYKCEIKIVRVFKGAEEYLHRENAISPIMENDKIMVGGFGDPNICYNMAHEGDTKILFMQVDINGHLMLDSSLLTVTYNNLELLDGAVNDLPVITKPPLEKGACDRVLCTFGAYCMEMEGGKPMCVCPDSCEGVSAPVCGSDRVTYQSECHMKVASCEWKELKTVLNHGECGSGTKEMTVDPCEELRCGDGEECRIHPDGEATCECNEDCGGLEAPVCASNGRVYDNECKMMLAACRKGKNISVIYEGQCDPCKGVDYGDGAVCRLDQTRSAVAACADPCPEEFHPICGSDGVMYNSSCQMEDAACEANMEISAVPEQGCAEDGPCVQQPCEFGSCHLSSGLEVSCVCPSDCEAVYVPVCASDGVTYSSVCEMERRACHSKMELMVLYKRECEQDLDVCSKMDCKYGAVCSEEGGVGMCVCSMNCSTEMDPVCGSDMVTYPSPCEVERAICLQQTEIEIISMGECDLCEGFSCEFGAHCRVTEEGPICQCADLCNEAYQPVCGSDGVTYPNLCYMWRAGCRMVQEITVASEGQCDLCLNVNCTNGARCKNGVCKCKGSCPFIYDPVCGTNGVTYENECKLDLARCRRDPMLEVAYGGECEEVEGPSGYGSGSGDWSGDDSTPRAATVTMGMSEFQKCDEYTCAYGGVCVPAGGPGGMRCSCNMSCPAIRSMVCGSDGETYGNECQLKEASCEGQRSIVKDECEDVEQEPCDGETPLTDPDSGDEFTCTEKNRGDECPSGSYCHIHPMGSFAVCCPVGETARPTPSLCEGSPYGCCPDGETPAEGLNDEGCEERDCFCNEIGAYSNTCDDQGQCSCRPGVTGELCNSCAPGYWNFKDILDGNEGCEPCDCNKAGSARDDCGQNYGECVCKEGVTGIKCEKCPAGQIMGSLGCKNDVMTEAMTCAERECSFGADCVDINDTSICECPSDCPGSGEQVCGSDGQTYSTECQMRVIGCRSEKDLYVESTGPCETSIQKPTDALPFCAMSEYGCCPDGESMAMGDNYEGCEESTTEPVIVDGTMAPENTSIPVMSCESSPCKRGGSCMDSDMAPGFVCHCPLGTGGPVCMETIQFEYPSFSGDSYIAYETIRGFLKVSAVVEFKTSASDGLIFYSGQSEDGYGDFIALVLVDKHVQLRFDLGSREPVIVTSNVEIEPDTWYRVVTSRMKKKGMVSVDGEPKVSGSAKSGSSGLNLKTEMFIGDVAESHDRVYSRLGVSNGLMGSIRHLEVNNEVYDLKYPQDMGDMLYGANIGNGGTDRCLNNRCQHNSTCLPGEGEVYTCQCVGDFVGPYCADVFADQCEGHMCHHGSTCVPEPTGSYRCDCPPNVMGDRCDKVIEPIVAGPFIPYFGGDSYLELAGLEMSDRHEIEIEFLATEENGMIFYQGQKSDGNGDFHSLNLVDGYLEFRYDLGSGPAELRSMEKVSLNMWYTVVVIRDGKDGSLEIKGVEVIEGMSKMPEEDPEGDLAQLNLNQNLFLGGVPNYSEISRKAAITDGLVGAIRKLVLNGEEVTNFNASAINQVNVEAYIPDVCKADPCLPGFLCDGDTGECVCPEDLVQEGNRCVPGEMTLPTAMTTAVDGMEPDEGTEMATEGSVNMGTEPMVGGTEVVMPRVTDGMVPVETKPMPQVDMETEPVDHMATEAVVDMKTEPMVDMKTEHVVVTAKKDMTDAPSKTSKPMKAGMGDASTPTLKAVMEGKTTPTPAMPTREQTRPVPSFPPPPPMTTTVPPRRTTAPVVEPTTKMVTKTEIATTMATTVLPTTMFPTTLEPVSVDDPVSFTGSEYFAYRNLITKKAKAQSVNGGFTMRIKTDQEQGLIMWNGPTDFIGLAVVDGYVTFSFQLGAGTLSIVSTVYVADNIWHTVTAYRYIRAGTLVVDNEDPVLASARAGASQLNTDGVLYIGGAPNVPNGKIPSGFTTGFVGCIGYVEIENQPLHLYYDTITEQPEQFCSTRQ